MSVVAVQNPLIRRLKSLQQMRQVHLRGLYPEPTQVGFAQLLVQFQLPRMAGQAQMVAL